MSAIWQIHLDISDPKASLEFYVQRLGMRLRDTDTTSVPGATIYSLSFATGATLCLRHRADSISRSYRPTDNDAYWKIGVTIADVDIARERLIEQGTEVTEPVQFHDIGYLCHLDDPDGYCIELLQHRFARNHRRVTPIETEVLGHPANLGQLSLNVSSIEESLAFYRDKLGLKLLSRQDVPGRNFTLWFLGRRELNPPVDSIDAVENREWLWSLPETTLELRAFHDPVARRRAHPPEDELGFRGVGMTAAQEPHDPDGVRILKSKAAQTSYPSSISI